MDAEIALPKVDIKGPQIDVDINEPKVDANIALPSLGAMLEGNANIDINAPQMNIPSVDIYGTKLDAGLDIRGSKLDTRLDIRGPKLDAGLDIYGPKIWLFQCQKLIFTAIYYL